MRRVLMKRQSYLQRDKETQSGVVVGTATKTTPTVVSSYVEPGQPLTDTALLEHLLVGAPFFLKLSGEELVRELGMSNVPGDQDEGGVDDGDNVRAKSFKITSHFHLVDIAEVNVGDL